MSKGYGYGQKEPVEECGRCGGIARAEFVDVGVGYAQVAEFMCTSCGAEPEWKNGRCEWVLQRAAETGESVTGYVVTADGSVMETTFDRDHAWLFGRMGVSGSSFVANGGVRITNLEGFAIDLPPFMAPRAKRALGRVLKQADWSWGDPYVLPWGERSGREMTRGELAALVSRLPEKPPAPSGPSP